MVTKVCSFVTGFGYAYTSPKVSPKGATLLLNATIPLSVAKYTLPLLLSTLTFKILFDGNGELSLLKI